MSRPPVPERRTPDGGSDDDATRPSPGTSFRPGPGGRWSRSTEDLSSERLLRSCPRVTIDGEARPSFGRYALLSKLGQGGMGIVYHAVHAKLGTEVAIKV